MFTTQSRTATKVLTRLRHQIHPTSRPYSFRAHTAYAQRRQQHFFRSLIFVTSVASAATAYHWYNGGLIQEAHAEAPPPVVPGEIVYEKARKRGTSKNDNRDQISSQHLQVKKSWEKPGVYCWGNNEGKVASPDANATLIRTPRWLPYFDGVLLRDMKLTKDFGAAISENGDLMQWGMAYNKDEKTPVTTLKGKNLISVEISQDRVLALGHDGKVYSLSVSQSEQILGPKPVESSWFGLSSTKSPISYRLLNPQDFTWSEKVTSISGGLDHLLMCTSKGRVFAAAAGSEEYPTKGQLGVPGLTWFTKPPGPYDQPHEVLGLKGFQIKQVAAGDHHSVAVDTSGRVFAWGDNGRGQLGIGDTSKDNPYFDAPSLIPMTKLYAGTNQSPAVTAVYAGGNTTFLTVDAKRIAAPNADSAAVANRGKGLITADTWACGHGIWGQLGNGRWTHVQSLPTKIVPLSGLFEYDEGARRAVPIRLRSISVGANHVAATMDNVTYTLASDTTSENDTNWGADVLFFGNNEHFQLGTGKRNNVVTPTYIQPLDRVAEVQEGMRPKQEMHRFHATPLSDVKVKGRWVKFEQKVVCGRGVTAVYSAVPGP